MYLNRQRPVAAQQVAACAAADAGAVAAWLARDPSVVSQPRPTSASPISALPHRAASVQVVRPSPGLIAGHARGEQLVDRLIDAGATYEVSINNWNAPPQDMASPGRSRATPQSRLRAYRPDGSPRGGGDACPVHAHRTGRRTVDGIARPAGISHRGAQALLDAMVALELVRVADGRYENSAEGFEERTLAALTPCSRINLVLYYEVSARLSGRDDTSRAATSDGNGLS